MTHEISIQTDQGKPFKARTRCSCGYAGQWRPVAIFLPCDPKTGHDLCDVEEKPAELESVNG